jgi:hypothetical protein
VLDMSAVWEAIDLLEVSREAVSFFGVSNCVSVFVMWHKVPLLACSEECFCLNYEQRSVSALGSVHKSVQVADFFLEIA